MEEPVEEHKTPSPGKSEVEMAQYLLLRFSRVEELLERLKDKLATRGARGILGLGRQFRIMDDDNSNTINFVEFKKTMRDYKLGFNDSEVETLFKAFDVNNDERILYDEFLRIIRGKLNDNRRQWVVRAFKILDIDQSGEVTLSDIERRYNAKMHPDVKAGKSTEEEVLTEFLETFEMHHNILMGKEADGKVTLEEFEEYYSNVSASIDSDEYFELMMKQAWKLDEAAKIYKKGWKDEEEEKAPKDSPSSSISKSPYKRGFGNTSSVDNPLKLQSELNAYKRSPEKKPVALDKFRKVLSTRGARGIIGLSKQFRIIDTDGSNQVNLDEFLQIIKDFKIPIDDRDIRNLFEMFDRDRSGFINYDEFLKGVRGKMNPARQALVEQAFKKLDKDNSGEIDIRDLKDVYSTRNHPDVRSGERTEEQVLEEFLETFETYKNLYGGKNDQIVTKEEFMAYYSNISASIDDDKYFETLMNNAWKLKSETPKRTTWSEVYTNPRPLTASQNAPFGTTEEPVDYSTSLRPNRGKALEESKKVLAAGCPTWTKASPLKTPEKSYNEKQLLIGFRKVLLGRGVRGVLNLQRAFKNADEDNKKQLTLAKFKRIVKEHRLRYPDNDIERLFSIFDTNGSGAINYDALIRDVIVRFVDEIG